MTPAELAADMQAGYAFAIACCRHRLLLAGDDFAREHETVCIFVLLAIARRG